MDPIIDTATWLRLKGIILGAIGWLDQTILFDIDFSSGYNLHISFWDFLFSAFCFGILWDGFMSLYQQGTGGEDG